MGLGGPYVVTMQTGDTGEDSQSIVISHGGSCVQDFEPNTETPGN